MRLNIITPPAPTPCADDPDLFFDEERVNEAKAICAGCYFAPDCANFAVGNGEEYGVWGGVEMTPREADPEAETPIVPINNRQKRMTRVLAMHDQGLSRDRIAELTGLSRKRVATIIREGMAEKPQKRSEARAQLWAAIVETRKAEGLTYDELAARFEISVRTVTRAVAANAA